jgi:hypothetical protein
MYAGRSMLKTVVLERGINGGELLNTELVEDYPGFESILGHELAQKFSDHAAKFGAEFKNGRHLADPCRDLFKPCSELRDGGRQFLCTRPVVGARGPQEQEAGHQVSALLIWVAFPFNAIVNRWRGYSLRTSFVLTRLSWKIERHYR